MTRLAAPLAAVLLSACVAERTRVLPTYRTCGAGAACVDRTPAPEPVPPPALERARDLVRVEPPARGASGAVRSGSVRAIEPIADPAKAARERFVAHETEIRADQATVHLPAALAREARLGGRTVEVAAGNRRIASGDATLSVRRLTVRAGRVTLVERPAGEESVAVAARGSVSFTSNQRASRIEETGLRSLLVRDDAYTPLE
jgi:hypothetical protein